MGIPFIPDEAFLAAVFYPLVRRFQHGICFRETFLSKPSFIVEHATLFIVAFAELFS
tara:strand:- start:725 stop:895 length:171 start_codon:yes stop_codon:yes gene_type:complete